MTQATAKIEFDQEIYKTVPMEGPFPTLTALKSACVPMTPEHPSWEAYAKWSSDMCVDSASGSIITSVYSPFQRQRRSKELVQQLAEITKEDIKKHKLPEFLKEAFGKAISVDSSSPVRVLMMTTTQWNPAFALRKEFPELDIRAICVSPETKDAVANNKLIFEASPATAYAIRYVSDIQSVKADIVFSDFECMYRGEKGLSNHLSNLAATGAKHIIISNVFSNVSESGEAQWYAQRAFGGVIPFRIPARGEIVTLMDEARYAPSVTTQAAMNIPLDPNSAFNMKTPQTDNFHFVRKLVPTPIR